MKSQSGILCLTLLAASFGCGNTNKDDAGDAGVSEDGSNGDGSSGDAALLDSGTSEAEASVDGAAPVYPDCIGPGAFSGYLACDATHSCVPNCTGCVGASIRCAIPSLGVSRCAASCDSCHAPDAGNLALSDSCGGTCTNTKKDDRNCGTCGHECSTGASAMCIDGHCCGNLPNGQPTTWFADCSMCCGGGCPPMYLANQCAPEG